MVRFAASLTYMFTELPMTQRFAAARRAGFDGVEILFPYDLPTDELRKSLHANRLEFVLMNTPAPNWSGGPRGFAALPGNSHRFRTDFERALRCAHALRAGHINIMPGKAEGADARRSLIENLTWAARRAPQVSLVIEATNRADMPGCFLDSLDLAAEIITEVDASNLGLQFDIYHAQMIHADPIDCWTRLSSFVRHIQIAGTPGRHEPRGGEIDFARFFREVARSGYKGWISAEYIPATTTDAGLHWLTRR